MKSLLIKWYKAKKESFQKHKWLESEKVGYDIGVFKATISWIF